MGSTIYVGRQNLLSAIHPHPRSLTVADTHIDAPKVFVMSNLAISEHIPVIRFLGHYQNINTLKVTVHLPWCYKGDWPVASTGFTISKARGERLP